MGGKFFLEYRIGIGDDRVDHARRVPAEITESHDGLSEERPGRDVHFSEIEEGAGGLCHRFRLLNQLGEHLPTHGAARQRCASGQAGQHRISNHFITLIHESEIYEGQWLVKDCSENIASAVDGSVKTLSKRT